MSLFHHQKEIPKTETSQGSQDLKYRITTYVYEHCEIRHHLYFIYSPSDKEQSEKTHIDVIPFYNCKNITVVRFSLYNSRKKL